MKRKSERLKEKANKKTKVDKAMVLADIYNYDSSSINNDNKSQIGFLSKN